MVPTRLKQSESALPRAASCPVLRANKDKLMKP